MEEDYSAVSITANLGTSIIGRRVIYFPRLPSTMVKARQEVQREAAEGTVIIAGEQLEGRGRVKRAWLSPPGNIALSVILYPPVTCLPYLVMLASIAVARSIEAVAALKPQIKWPNDILINGKKVCGILLESQVRKDRVIYAIAGIGINVSLRAADFPEIQLTATSLNEELGRKISRLALIRQLLVEMERLYLSLPESEAIYHEWESRLITLGKRVSVTSSYNMLEGIAESVDRNGALMLRQDNGRLIRIIAGDVTLREK
ncbi:MAG: biotin--[acetyl-CoA-carboxylase] ligase [Chloroflexi bacterium RBG_16_50_9]|nr:MAG: biotin--[acetyl-CoA-carboxylase] ligase [Chloroflexi bacterium RBG_16_50_9]